MSKAKPTKAARPSKSKAKPAKKPASPRPRITMLGNHSVTSVLKFMGAQNFTTEQATNAVAKLASGPVAPATISTGLSDGRSEKYSAGAAKLSAAEAKQLKAAAK